MRHSSARFRRSASVVSSENDDGTLITVVHDDKDDDNNNNDLLDLEEAAADATVPMQPAVVASDTEIADADIAVNIAAVSDSEDDNDSDATRPASGAAADIFEGLALSGPPEAVEAVRAILADLLVINEG